MITLRNRMARLPEIQKLSLHHQPLTFFYPDNLNVGIDSPYLAGIPEGVDKVVHPEIVNNHLKLEPR